MFAWVTRRLAAADLRFKPQDEEVYKRSLQRDLVRSMEVVALVLATLTILINAPHVCSQLWRDDAPLDGSLSDSRTIVFAFRALHVVLGSATTLLCRSWRKLGYPSWRLDWEKFFVVIFLCYICTQPIVSPKFMAKVYGKDPDAVWGFETCGGLMFSLVNLDMAITASALFVPFRTVAFWIPTAAVVTVYLVMAVCIVPTKFYTTGSMMVCLCFMAFVGAWRHEKHAREKWGAVHMLKQTEQKVDEQHAVIETGFALTRGFEAVLSTLCDRVLKLDQDGYAVASEKAVDAFFGRAMAQQRFMDAVAARDHGRLQSAYQQAVASATPVCLQLTIVRGTSGDREASVVIMALEASCPRFIVGLRQEHDTAEHSTEAVLSMDADSSAELRGPGPRTNADTATMSALESLPSTSPTGDIFALRGQDTPASIERLMALGMAEQWLISSEEVTLSPGALLGSGGFGMVVGARYNGTEVAIKVPLAATHTLCASDMLQICNELRLLRHLRHPNIVSMYGAMCDPTNFDIALVMELLQGTSLSTFLTEHYAGNVVRIRLLADIVAALQCMHTKQPAIVHGDLKDLNIFVEKHQRRGSQWRAKLLDFGLSKLRTKRSRLRGGSLHWMPPEQAVSRGTTPQTSADIYAFGRVVFFVVTGVRPRGQLSRPDVKQSLETAAAPPLVWNLDSILAPSHKPVMEKCCQVEPERRPAIQEVQRMLRAAAAEALGAFLSYDDDVPKTSVHEFLEHARKLFVSTAAVAQDPALSRPSEATPPHMGDLDPCASDDADFPESIGTRSQVPSRGSSPRDG